MGRTEGADLLGDSTGADPFHVAVAPGVHREPVGFSRVTIFNPVAGIVDQQIGILGKVAAIDI